MQLHLLWFGKINCISAFAPIWYVNFHSTSRMLDHIRLFSTLFHNPLWQVPSAGMFQCTQGLQWPRTSSKLNIKCEKKKKRANKLILTQKFSWVKTVQNWEVVCGFILLTPIKKRQYLLWLLYSIEFKITVMNKFLVSVLSSSFLSSFTQKWKLQKGKHVSWPGMTCISDVLFHFEKKTFISD